MRLAFLLLLAALALMAVLRIFVVVRRARRRSEHDWDAMMIRNMRASGANAFTAYPIDFFFSLPDQAACLAVRAVLEPEGFSIDQRPMHSESGELLEGFSLHARKSLRISLEDMQHFTHRFGELAREHGGTYDGWASELAHPPPAYVPPRKIH